MTVPSTRNVDAVALRYACQAYDRACRDGNGIAMLSALDSIRAALTANTHRTTDDDAGPLAQVEPADIATAVSLGIDHALRDLGADLTGCTPSMMSGHVIRELRRAGLHPHKRTRGGHA